MPNVWMIGDPHFYHNNIIKYENRPFSSVDEMNKALIDNWNSKVRKDDKVIVAGDFCFKATEHAKEILDNLKGYKILIMGNHDTVSPMRFIEAGFKEVYRYPIIYDGFYIISHEPMYVNANTPYANIFAHVHSNPAYADYTSQTFCVSVERPELNYYPIEFNRIKKLMSSVK